MSKGSATQYLRTIEIHSPRCYSIFRLSLSGNRTQKQNMYFKTNKIIDY